MSTRRSSPLSRHCVQRIKLKKNKRRMTKIRQRYSRFTSYLVYILIPCQRAQRRRYRENTNYSFTYIHIVPYTNMFNSFFFLYIRPRLYISVVLLKIYCKRLHKRLSKYYACIHIYPCFFTP